MGRLYKPNEFYEATGVSRETLRHYVEKGLLYPAETTEKGYALYGEREVMQMMLLRYYRSCNMTVEEVRDLLWSKDMPDQIQELDRAAESLEELASQMGVDATVLKNEVDKYNRAVETKVDPEYDRDPASLVYPIEKGPFYALETRIRNLGTYGGLVTDETLAVYGEDGRVIPGLYAAGFDALEWIGTSYFVDTTTLGWMTASGYMAGNSVVEYVK